MDIKQLEKIEREYERVRRMRREVREMLAEVRQTQFVKSILLGILPAVSSFIIIYYLVNLIVNR